MAETKVYRKKGRYNYKEKKLIDAIREKLAEKQAKDPNFAIEPATSYEQLQHLHMNIMADEATFEEVSSSATPNEEIDTQQTSNMSEETETVEEVEQVASAEESTAGRDFVDPFNRENPIVRDYVLGDDDYPDSKESQETADAVQDSFDEPSSETDAFLMDEDLQKEEEKDGKSEGSGSDSAKKEEKKEDKSVNPAFDEMSKKKQKRATKRFAKHIVFAVTALLEKGFVYWTTRKINEAKLVEYEITNEVDLGILLSLENGQDMTVKQFFQGLNVQAEEMSKISEEDKEDLIEALTEVLMEKGFAPSPSQELAMVGLSIVGQMALNAIGMNAQINTVIRLASTGEEGGGEEYVAPEPEQSYDAGESEQSTTHEGDFSQVAEEVEETEGVIEEPIEDENLLLEENTVVTKE